MADLIQEAEQFASVLADVVNGTVGRDVNFIVTPLDDPHEFAWVYPEGSSPNKPVLIPIVAGLDDGIAARLWLKVGFLVRLDDTGRHLAVDTSFFSLVIDSKSERPAIRMEYDRGRGSEPDDEEAGTHRRSAAHVQVHGSSDELSYVQGLRGAGKLRALKDFHIPVGGRRFRPTLEDFIEFLGMEDLIPLHPGWASVVARHRPGWLALQLRAAVRNDPETAIAQLTTMGYDVSRPAS